MEITPHLVEAYLEVGILGLAAITLILVVIYLVRKLWLSSKNKTEFTNNQYSQLLNMITEQNKQLTNTLINNNKQIMVDTVNEITNHTPSKEDDYKQSKINEGIDSCLQDILIEAKADRVAIIQYHNGGRGMNKQSFQRMSMTNEQVQIGIKPVISKYKDQFRNIIAYIIKELETNGYCYITDIEEIKSKDIASYEFLSNGCTKSCYTYAIENSDNCVIGFILINFEKKSYKDVDKIKTILQQHYNTIETLLNL